MIFCWDGDLDIKNNWPHFDYLYGQHWSFLKYSEHARYLPLKIKLQMQTTFASNLKSDKTFVTQHC